MKRSFVVEEIMLDGVSGEVRGTVELDPLGGVIDDLDCRWFQFRRDDTDGPIALNDQQRSVAVAVVERALKSDSELSASDRMLVLSGEAFSPRPSNSASTRILAEYLESASRTAPAPRTAPADESYDGQPRMRRAQ